MNLSEVLTHQRNFYKDRPAMDAANTTDFLISAIIAEARELTEQPPEYMETQTYLEQELSDVLLFSFALADKIRGDQTLEDFLCSIIIEKVGRNSVKYPASNFQEGIPYDMGVTASKDYFNSRFLNEQFYEASKV